MALSADKIKSLLDRVYNNKMIKDEQNGIDDENDIKEYCKKVFGDGSVTPDPSMLHQFNNIVVQQADVIAKPMVTNLVSLLATMETGRPGELKEYTIPVQTKARVKWAAKGTGVDLVRVEAGKKSIAVPTTLETGFYYEPLDMVVDSVNNYRKLVNDIANAKVRLYLDTITKLITSAISTAKIPAKNVKTGNNITIADYNKIASVLARYGGRPIFVADTLLIDYFAQQQASDSTIKNLLTDPLREELLTSLNPSTIGRTTAMNLVNPFIDDANSKTELPVNIGYMFAGSVSQKPFYVVEYGGMRQYTEQNAEDERIKMMIKQDAAVDLLFGNAVGYIKEDAAVAL